MSEALTIHANEGLLSLLAELADLQMSSREEVMAWLLAKVCSTEVASLRIKKHQEDRLQSLIDRTLGHGPQGTCWLWKGVKDHHLYARFKPGGSSYISVHRLMYTRKYGSIPVGKVCDHLCRVRHCVNPDHIELVTSRVNTQRGEGGKFQRDKSHCPKGHEYTSENTYHYRGSRHCVACRTISWKQRNERLKKERKERINGRNGDGVSSITISACEARDVCPA